MGSSTLFAQESEEEAPSKPEVEFVWSQFVASSIIEGGDSDPVYGGRVDIYAEVPGSAIGLDDSITIDIHPEFRYGTGVNGDIGLLPSQTGLFYPADDGEEFDLSVSVTKRWKSGTTLQVGKVNVLDIAQGLPVVGGGGIEGFQNLAFALPPSTIVPQELVGALLTVPTKKALYRLWVFDPELRTQDSGLEDPFSTGVGALASVTFPVKLGGEPGYYAVKLAGTTRTGPPVEVLPSVLVPPAGANFGRKKGTASIVLAGYQFLDTYEDAPGKGWGVFGQVFFSDGDPTPLDVSGFFGVSGNPKFRPQDRFGVAWFRYSLSDGLVRDLDHVLAFEDEEGIEAFYTFEVAKPLRITADVQYIDSSIKSRKPGWVLSLRAVTRF
ncbi:carbohydrate porin [Parerythrobacter jejuensis]|uniref:carbohydrate porin n=1 Tax=Parerythrobacter jejuensis TaxID=795812 RepID=UPI0031DFFAD3